MEKKPTPPKSLIELLDRIGEVADEREEPSFEDIMDAVGRRSFGPLLLLVGVVTVAPGIGDIPGVPTVMGIFVLLVSAQLLFGREKFWLPQWMLQRSTTPEKLKKITTTKWTRKPAGWIDKLVIRRLEFFTGKKATYAIAVACTVLALTLPVTEFVPLSTNGISIGLVAFGISLVAGDGLMALLGFVISMGTIALIVMTLT
jgi:hypothetical protein